MCLLSTPPNITWLFPTDLRLACILVTSLVGIECSIKDTTRWRGNNQGEVPLGTLDLSLYGEWRNGHHRGCAVLRPAFTFIHVKLIVVPITP